MNGAKGLQPIGWLMEGLLIRIGEARVQARRPNNKSNADSRPGERQPNDQIDKRADHQRDTFETEASTRRHAGE